METKTTVEAQPNDLLQQCRQHFPGLAWEFDHDGDCTAHFYGIDFYLSPEIDGSFSASILFNDKRWDWEERGFPSAASALAQAAARWQEFAALAMTVAGPLPEPRATEEQAQRSHRALVKAGAMAWAEDNPTDSNQNQPQGEK